MSDNDFSGSNPIRRIWHWIRAKAQGFVFRKTLKEFTNKEIAEVVIPDGVTIIGDWAFNGCTGLTSVVIPDSVTIIGDWAFFRCTGLTSVVIPDSVTKIGGKAFEGAGCEEQVKRDYPHLFE